MACSGACGDVSGLTSLGASHALQKKKKKKKKKKKRKRERDFEKLDDARLVTCVNTRAFPSSSYIDYHLLAGFIQT